MTTVEINPKDPRSVINVQKNVQVISYLTSLGIPTSSGTNAILNLSSMTACLVNLNNPDLSSTIKSQIFANFIDLIVDTCAPTSSFSGSNITFALPTSNGTFTYVASIQTSGTGSSTALGGASTYVEGTDTSDIAEATEEAEASAQSSADDASEALSSSS